jgi:predicted amino acid dehydrogenase
LSALDHVARSVEESYLRLLHAYDCATSDEERSRARLSARRTYRALRHLAQAGADVHVIGGPHWLTYEEQDHADQVHL